jgi:hypothetical protein
MPTSSGSKWRSWRGTTAPPDHAELACSHQGDKHLFADGLARCARSGLALSDATVAFTRSGRTASGNYPADKRCFVTTAEGKYAVSRPAREQAPVNDRGKGFERGTVLRITSVF